MSSKLINNNIRKDIKYLNKDFGEIRQELIDYTKNYFPDTYNDFNESSPGMMFMELAAATGDILSFYTDIQLRESLLLTVEENQNLFNIAHSLGYKPKFRTPASVDLDVFQLVPSINNGTSVVPDFRYCLQMDSNMIVSSESNKTFRTIDSVDFSYSSSFDSTEITVYSLDNTGEVEYFLLKKNVKAVSGEILTASYNFDSPKPYDKIVLPQLDVLEIVDIYDSNNNKWYETPYLAQDLVPISVPNLPYNDSHLAKYRSTAPYLIQFKQTERRFVTRLRENNRFEIQFGSGVSSEYDEEIIPNPFNVGFGLDYFERAVDLSIDPKNFLYTKTYGKSPANTTLTVRYTVGGGVEDNVGANSISTIVQSNITTPQSNLDSQIYNAVLDSVAINNPKPASGGLSRRSVEDVRREALANFASQNRAVTRDDYIVRVYSMPVKFGAIAKVCVDLDDQYLDNSMDIQNINYFGINLHCLGYDENKNLAVLNDAVKFNLLNYLKEYRIMTDSVSIRDAFIINIGVDFEIIVDEVYNSNEVLLRCIKSLKDYFDIEKMGIGKPIFKNSVMKEISQVEGVISVTNLSIFNLYDVTLGYSGNVYDIDSATKRNIIYTSLDQSIFEVKYPNKDIRGRVVNY
jgi:hypothetical protein